MKLYGAILGDIVGQPYEYKYDGDFSEFIFYDDNATITDDTLMTIATAAKLIGYYETYEKAYKDIGNKYAGPFYGKSFNKWLKTEMGTQNDSCGNGCLMRLSPIFYLPKQKQLLEMVNSVICSHNHEKSLLAAFNLKDLYNKYKKLIFKSKRIKTINKFNISAESTIKFIAKNAYKFKSTHEAIELVVKCGGDTDTNASIMGELMNYRFNDITKNDIDFVNSKLDNNLINILFEFNKKFN